VQEPVDVKARAFDMIVAARKVHVDAVAAYNARLELVRAERLRGNWQLNTDQEFKATSEAQSSLFRIVKDLCDNALSTSQSDPVPEASLGGSDEPYWCVNGKLYPRRKTIETSLASLERHIREAIEEHGESPRFSWLEKDARDIRAALSTTATDGE
jgi:hypothetical protein